MYTGQVKRHIRSDRAGEPEDAEAIIASLEAGGYETIADLMDAADEVVSYALGDVQVLDDGEPCGYIARSGRGVEYTDTREHYGPWDADEMRESGL
jgi:hypothetical protein